MSRQPFWYVIYERNGNRRSTGQFRTQAEAERLASQIRKQGFEVRVTYAYPTITGD